MPPVIVYRNGVALIIELIDAPAVNAFAIFGIVIIEVFISDLGIVVAVKECYTTYFFCTVQGGYLFYFAENTVIGYGYTLTLTSGRGSKIVSGVGIGGGVIISIGNRGQIVAGIGIGHCFQCVGACAGISDIRQIAVSSVRECVDPACTICDGVYIESGIIT